MSNSVMSRSASAPLLPGLTRDMGRPDGIHQQESQRCFTSPSNRFLSQRALAHSLVLSPSITSPPASPAPTAWLLSGSLPSDLHPRALYCSSCLSSLAPLSASRSKSSSCSSSGISAGPLMLRKTLSDNDLVGLTRRCTASCHVAGDQPRSNDLTPQSRRAVVGGDPQRAPVCCGGSSPIADDAWRHKNSFGKTRKGSFRRASFGEFAAGPTEPSISEAADEDASASDIPIDSTEIRASCEREKSVKESCDEPQALVRGREGLETSPRPAEKGFSQGDSWLFLGLGLRPGGSPVSKPEGLVTSLLTAGVQGFEPPHGPPFRMQDGPQDPFQSSHAPNPESCASEDSTILSDSFGSPSDVSMGPMDPLSMHKSCSLDCCLPSSKGVLSGPASHHGGSPFYPSAKDPGWPMEPFSLLEQPSHISFGGLVTGGVPAGFLGPVPGIPPEVPSPPPTIVSEILDLESVPRPLESKPDPAEEAQASGRPGGFLEGGRTGTGMTESYYERALERDPTNVLILRNFARFLVEARGDFEAAEHCLERAILVCPGDADVLVQYAKLLWDYRRDAERAVAYFERAVQASPDDCYVLAAYASFLWTIEAAATSSGPPPFGPSHPPLPAPLSPV